MKLKGTRGVVYGSPYESDKTPMVIVAPGSFESLYWHNPDKRSGFDQFSLVTAFTEISPEIIAKLKVDGTSAERPFNDQDVGCSMTAIGLPNGQVWIYENTSETFDFSEMVRFELEGAAIAGSPNSYFRV